MEQAVLVVDVHRRDLLGRECVVCEEGIYTAQNSLDTTVVCSSCGDTIERWRTKRELLEHACEKETI